MQVKTVGAAIREVVWLQVGGVADVGRWCGGRQWWERVNGEPTVACFRTEVVTCHGRKVVDV